MKKVILALTSIALVLSLIPATVFAGHGHGNGHGNGNGNGRGQNQGSGVCKTYYELCDIEDCHTRGLHTHKDETYAGHYIGDGHDYHKVCDYSGCVETEVHIHDKNTYFPYYCGTGQHYYKNCVCR